MSEPKPLDVQVGGNHYKKFAIQPFEMGMSNHYDPCLFSVLKYVSRHREKGGEQDLRKAAHIIGIRRQIMSDLLSGPRIREAHKRPAGAITMEVYCQKNGIHGRDKTILFMVDRLAFPPFSAPSLSEDILQDDLIAEIEMLIEETYIGSHVDG